VKLYEFALEPSSGFATPLKGDTLFGHFCWQAAYDPSLLNGGLEKWVKVYSDRPFAVFSSAWPRIQRDKIQFALKRFDLPASVLFPAKAGEDRKTRILQHKKNMRKKWMLLDEDLSMSLDVVQFIDDQELFRQAAGNGLEPQTGCAVPVAERQFVSMFAQPHNSINRLTSTTGEAGFTPFSTSSNVYFPGAVLSVFGLIDEEATDVERVATALRRIGCFGYGKDASTGKGRFQIRFARELAMPAQGSSNACYLLAPCVPEKGLFAHTFFSPFTRFGKHGDRLAHARQPFKNPVIMADEGGVLVVHDDSVFAKPYIGRAVLNTSKSQKEAVVQGYSPYLPLRLEI